jgi:3-methyladenine DNA glycosylase AlkD
MCEQLFGELDLSFCQRSPVAASAFILIYCLLIYAENEKYSPGIFSILAKLAAAARAHNYR